MHTPKDARLGAFLREVSNWTWAKYVEAEHDLNYTSNQAIIFGLIRSCAMQNLQAIRLSINRLDGKLVTPLKIEYPKIFYLYPNAKPSELQGNKTEVIEGQSSATKTLIVATEVVEEEPDLPSLSIRDTVAKMSELTRLLPQQIIDQAVVTEQHLKHKGPPPHETLLVKSVIAAHLLTMAQNRSIDALGEVFDSIDGKLAETFQVLGEDLYITNYSYVAPDNAYANEDGILQVEATASQDMWAQKLSKGIKN